jgi:hypothetical protein
MNKQKVLQIIVAVVSVLSVIVGLAPQVNLLPASWQPYAVSIFAITLVLEKVLVATNQILVGPTKLQSANAQTMLAELPDKSNAPSSDPINQISLTPPTPNITSTPKST